MKTEVPMPNTRIPAAAPALVPAITYTVGDVKTLIKTIAPGRIIVLKKGDYRLSAGYGTKSDYVAWSDYDDGKELTLNNLSNLTIRGADGARIIVDSGAAYLLAVFGGRGIAFDNIRFVREVKEGTDVYGGSVYAESTEGLSFDRCVFEGPTGTAFDLWESSGFTVKRSELHGSSSGFLSAVSTTGIEFADTWIAGCEGYPLAYLEESDQIAFRNCDFEMNSGGSFIEIYAEAGYVESVAFEGCRFTDNSFDFFSGTQVLPYADEYCEYEGNSFDETWPETSVASSQDESYYGIETGPAVYDHYGSGLSFAYPLDWEIQEYAEKDRVGLFSPDAASLVLFATAYRIPEGMDPGKQGKKIFSDAAAALAKLLKADSGLSITIKAETEPYDADGIPAQDFRGGVVNDSGGKGFVRARLFINEGGVQAMVAIADDEAALEPDTEIDGIFSSVSLIEGGY
jgi:hypothetical protein